MDLEFTTYEMMDRDEIINQMTDSEYYTYLDTISSIAQAAQKAYQRALFVENHKTHPTEDVVKFYKGLICYLEHIIDHLVMERARYDVC